MQQQQQQKPILYCVGVPDDVYASLQARFDRGEKEVYSGKTDGTDRLLARRKDGCIYDAHNGMQLRSYGSLGSVGVPPGEPHSRYAQAMLKANAGRSLKDFKGIFEYDSKGKFIGAAGMTPRQLRKDALPSCPVCGAEGARLLCGRCRAVRYCSKECQAVDWKEHKKKGCCCCEKKKE